MRTLTEPSTVVRRVRLLLRPSSWDVTVHSPSSPRARGPGQTKRYGPWHVITCSQAHSRLLCNLLNGWCQPRSHRAPRSWPSANIESKSCTTCLGPFVLRKPACARTLICQRHQPQFEGVSARGCDGQKLGPTPDSSTAYQRWQTERSLFSSIDTYIYIDIVSPSSHVKKKFRE